MNTNIAPKLAAFALTVQHQQVQRLQEQHLDCEANLKNAMTSIKPGKKFTKVDIGTNGRYMVENATGNIFGIKAYGQVHRGHWYGTLDTTDQYFWGNYYPEKVGGKAKLAPGRGNGPALTFAPELAKA